jgi:putative transposase
VAAKSLHVDKGGMPLGVVVVGANIHDSRLVGVTFQQSFADFESQGVGSSPDNLCLDKGYDFERVRLEVRENGLQPHVRSRGEEIAQKSYPARRWVVERTFAWLKGFRALRTRYCQRLCNYLAMVHFACAIILFRKIAPGMQ